MIPAHVLTLEALPLTPHGKVDRKALPAPERVAAAAGFVAPATPTERALAELWQRVLRIERVGALDNFFESGGHSLLAMQLVAGVRERFGVELPLRTLIGRPALAHMAEIIELRKAEGIARQPDGIVPLQPRGTRIPVYAVGGHNGDVFAFRDLARHLGEDQPFFGLQPPGLDGRSEPLARVEDIAACLAAQIRAFQPSGPCVIAGYCAGGSVAFELARPARARRRRARVRRAVRLRRTPASTASACATGPSASRCTRQSRRGCLRRARAGSTSRSAGARA